MQNNFVLKTLGKQKQAILRRTSKQSPDKITTPYFLTDLVVPEQKINQFKTLLPRVNLFYALKANNDSHIVQKIDPLLTGYDVASWGEIEQLLSLGIAPDRLMYSNPVKIPSHIENAYKAGVQYFAFDSLTEIEKLAHYAPGANVYLRLKVSDYGSKFPLSRKFGVDAMHSVDYCSVAADSGLKVKGITFHVGSQSENVQVWDQAIGIAGEVIAKLREKNINIEFLDLGGGFPADYGNPVPEINLIASAINQALHEHISDDISILAEPGRYIVANAGTIVTTIIGREHRSGADWLYLDFGTFQGLIEPLEMADWKYPIETDKSTHGYKKTFVLTGPSCDAFDTLGMDYILPSDMKVGDKLHIGSAGAYTLVYASNFNGFMPPKKYYVQSE